MKKQCIICRKEFETVKYGHSRQCCFECVPAGLNCHQITDYRRRSAKHQGVIDLGGKCLKCGETREHILHFHHVNPQEKDEVPSNLLISGHIKEFFEEINKCVLLCSNCHGDFHYLQVKNGITLQEYLQM